MIIQGMSLADLFMWVSFLFFFEPKCADGPAIWFFREQEPETAWFPPHLQTFFRCVLLNVELINLRGGVIWLLPFGTWLRAIDRGCRILI